MERTEFDALRSGAIVRHKHAGEAMVVVADYGTRKLAVRTTEVTNPAEWLLIAPAPGTVRVVAKGETDSYFRDRDSVLQGISSATADILAPATLDRSHVSCTARRAFTLVLLAVAYRVFHGRRPKARAAGLPSVSIGRRTKPFAVDGRPESPCGPATGAA
jgi:hypothetical protein